ncbi:MAG: hypothetical protein ACLSDJ_12070 [Butyricimonas faecihominis]
MSLFRGSKDEKRPFIVKTSDFSVRVLGTALIYHVTRMTYGLKQH